MVNVCMYFQVHQPNRLSNFSLFDMGSDKSYFDDKKNEEIIRKVARKCYLPTNNVLLKLIGQHKGKFRISFSLTGTLIEQLEKYVPDVLESFKELADTGCVEFLSETYHHNLSYQFSKKEFKEQLLLHSRKIKELFNQEPKVFRNTELIFNNELSRFIEELGYKAILAEGADHVLKGRNPNFVYKTVYADNIKVLMKNYKLSDDIAFRFSNKEWKEFPLTAEKHASWINSINGDGEIINLFMDYETFGEHQWEDTGIFNFLERWPSEVLKNPDNKFITPSEAADTFQARDVVDVHHFMSWADMERDLSAWLGNDLQVGAMKELYALEPYVKMTKDNKLIDKWRQLTTSDHFYYMCTKWFSDGDVHKYFNPYDSPYDAFITFMNILNDFTVKVKKNLDSGEKTASDIPSETLKVSNT